MVNIHRLLPVALLCVTLLAPTPVRSVSILQWIQLAINTLRTFLYYLIPLKRYQMRAIDDTLNGVTDILKDIMPATAPLANFEVKDLALHRGFVCFGEGSAGNFKTFEKTAKVVCTWDNDRSVSVAIPLRIKEFTVSYNKFVLTGFGFTKRGDVRIDFARNRLWLIVQIPNVLEMIGKLRSGGDCIMNITRVEVTQLKGLNVQVHSDGPTHGHATSNILTTHFSLHAGYLANSVREAFIGNIYLQLAQSVNTVCMDPALIKEVKTKGLDQIVPDSKTFLEFCGKNSPGKKRHRSLKKLISHRLSFGHKSRSDESDDTDVIMK